MSGATAGSHKASRAARAWRTTKANAKDGGRDGDAPQDKPHLGRPPGMRDVEAPPDKVDNLAGALAENRGRNPEGKAEPPGRRG